MKYILGNELLFFTIHHDILGILNNEIHVKLFSIGAGIYMVLYKLFFFLNVLGVIL